MPKEVVLFDDWFSIGHFILGFLTFFSSKFAWIFIFYELIEFLYKKEEKAKNFVGDLIEFFLGIAFGCLLFTPF